MYEVQRVQNTAEAEYVQVCVWEGGGGGDTTGPGVELWPAFMHAPPFPTRPPQMFGPFLPPPNCRWARSWIALRAPSMPSSSASSR